MGLDSFWKHPVEGSPEPEFDPPLSLCGGMFSGHGQGSFRGKVYNGIVEGVTGVSLYQEQIPNSTVREMAAKLAAHYSKLSVEGEEADLVRMFLAYAESGHDLLGWW